MPRVFLSSTFVDLSDIRQNICRWLSEVFKVDLIVMESFGSDAAPPDVTSVRRVRECDLFVGIYARRYGTVDPTTGKSITEMELDEAERAYSNGSVKDILLYLLDENAAWPAVSVHDVDKLKRLRERVQSHTPSYFRNADDLLLAVIRDLRRKLAEHFSGTRLQIRPQILPVTRTLRQPVGMEFLGSAQRRHLIGRSELIRHLMEGINDSPLLLLLGDSGIGKTSLINAGLMPSSAERGWRTVYVRPLGFPASDVAHQLQSSLFEHSQAYHRPLLPLLFECLDLLPEERLLLIIDQFEDVLVARSQKEVDRLIADLRAIHQSPDSRLRILVSYRADLEGRLGQLWQIVSGSASGLPRVYLAGLSVDEIQAGVVQSGEELAVSFEINRAEWDRIKNDLQLASAALGLPGAVYPPHVQMLIQHIWNSTEKGRLPYTAAQYHKARGVDGIVGDYLSRQLDYADDQEGHIRLVLVALVRSYGIKAQKRIEEIASEAGLDPGAVDLALEKLIDLRLVRHIDPYYEITHDFIARRVVSELVDSEEKEVKRFQELLSSKAAAHATTGALLTSQEMLLLYKHRERIVPAEFEMHLLLLSWLKSEGPALYWLLNPDGKAQTLSWIASELSNVEMERDEKASAVLLRMALENAPLTDDSFVALRSYKTALELASIIERNASTLPDSILLAGIRHPREEVSRICKRVVGSRFGAGQWRLLAQLKKSSNPRVRDAYYEYVTDSSLPLIETTGDRAIEQFRALQRIQRSPTDREATAEWSLLKKMRSGRDVELLGQSLLGIRHGRIRRLLSAAKSRSQRDVEAICRAVAGDLRADDFRALLAAYKDWNRSEHDEQSTPAACGKASALGRAIARTTKPEFAPSLSEPLKRINLTPSSRSLVLALLSNGEAESVNLVLQRIAECTTRIEYRDHTELGQAVARRMMVFRKGVPEFLLAILRKREFWDYTGGADPDPEMRLGLRAVENRALYIRIAGYAAVGAAADGETEPLLSLATHPYGLIARAAIIRLIRTSGAAAFKLLTSKMNGSMTERRATSFAGALRDAEIEHYRVATVW